MPKSQTVLEAPHIAVAKAIEIAKSFVITIYPQVNGIRLEEVDKSDDGLWDVVFSFESEKTERSELAMNLRFSTLAPNRLYKRVRVDSNGNPVAMKMVNG